MATAIENHQQGYITNARNSARKIFEGINELKAAQREWNALDYAASLADGAEANEGILATDIGAVVFATADALIAVLDAGSATNLAKLL